MIYHINTFCCIDYQVSERQILNFLKDGHLFINQLFNTTETTITKDLLHAIKNIYDNNDDTTKLIAYQHKLKVMLGREDADTLTLQQCEEALREIDQIEIPFMQTFNLWKRDSIAHNLIHSPILGRLAADLLGVDAVRVYQDSVFIKRPGDGPTLWHSDLNMCPFDTNDFLTIWIPLQDVPAESQGGSGLTFATASHRDFALPYCKPPYTTNHTALYALYVNSIMYV